jgi:hypothetical protein
MVNKVFNILMSLIISLLAGLIIMIPAYYIVYAFFLLSRDPKHPVMPVGPALAAFLVGLISFCISFYVCFKNNARIISWLKLRITK